MTALSPLLASCWVEACGFATVFFPVASSHASSLSCASVLHPELTPLVRLIQAATPSNVHHTSSTVVQPHAKESVGRKHGRRALVIPSTPISRQALVHPSTCIYQTRCSSKTRMTALNISLECSRILIAISSVPAFGARLLISSMSVRAYTSRVSSSRRPKRTLVVKLPLVGSRGRSASACICTLLLEHVT